MKIRSFNFENFGIIKKASGELHSNTVGFRGSNYSGKSTVATGIKYCLTNELKGKQEKTSSYIRNWDPKGKAHLEIEGESPSGESFQITKIIGNSSVERILRIGSDAPISKAKAFDEAMSAMFGTDVSAIARLAFSPQGALADMLNTLTSEREKLFMRVLDADYIQSAAKVVAARASALKAQAVDYEPLIMETRQRFNDLREELEEVERRLVVLKSEDNPIAMEKVLGELRRQTANLLYQENSLKESESTVRRLTELLRTSPARDNKKVEKLEAQKAALASSLFNLSLLQRRKELEASKEDAENQMRELFTQVDRSEEKASLTLAYPIAGMVNSETSVTLYEYPPVALTLTEIETEERMLAESWADHTEAKTELDGLNSLLTILDKSKEILSATGGSSCCPVCKSSGKLPEWSQEDERKLTGLREQIAELNRKVVGILKQCGQLERVTVKRKWWDTLVGLCGLENATIIAGNPSRVNDLKEHNSKMVAIVMQESTAKAKMQACIDRIEEATKTLQTLPEVTEDGALDKTTVERQLVETQIALDEENLRHEKVTKIEGNIEAASSQAEKCRAELREKGDSVYKALALVGAHFGSIERMHEEMVELKNSLMVDLENKEGLIKRMEQTVSSLEKYRKLSDGQRNKRVFVANLEDMASRLERVPKVFVRRQFESLVSVVSSILAEMDTMYEVKADPANAISFIYKDSAKDSIWLPQSKLSGSQSVRLSLAFLVAVQRALLPHIGFMVLDEPSLHLDPSGKKQLSDLFERLGHTIFSGNSQLLIFDYDDTVLSRCGQIIDLDAN